jgi:hypothetical protein
MFLIIADICHERPGSIEVPTPPQGLLRDSLSGLRRLIPHFSWLTDLKKEQAGTPGGCHDRQA